jgi:glycosyltransferase involved in cell wall biosynthesis
MPDGHGDAWGGPPGLRTAIGGAQPLVKILFAFENALTSTEADAEVAMTTAKYLAPLTAQSWLHVPSSNEQQFAGLTVIRAYAPARPAALRHLCCGLTLVFRKQFRQADLVYTRNLWIAWMALLFGQCVAFDHYRPWPDQIPPLQFWIFRLMRRAKFVVNICHSNYTMAKYLAVGVPVEKLVCIHNGFEPVRLNPPMSIAAAKQQLGIAATQKTVVYTGRLNHKKGLGLVIEAAKRLPDLLFILVGSYGNGPIEAMARDIPNIRIVGWQAPDALRHYIFAADLLLIPPSLKPLAEFGSTVLPLKVFLYMASHRPILAGDTPDIRELLTHKQNAFLCRPDCLDDLVAGITELMADTTLAARLSNQALADSADLTWDARAHRIADVLATRLRSRPAARTRWSASDYATWIRQSGRWLVHLVRTRSWVLPPHFARPAPACHAVHGE